MQILSKKLPKKKSQIPKIYSYFLSLSLLLSASLSLNSGSPPLSFFLSTNSTIKSFWWWLMFPPIWSMIRLNFVLSKYSFILSLSYMTFPLQIQMVP